MSNLLERTARAVVTSEVQSFELMEIPSSATTGQTFDGTVGVDPSGFQPYAGPSSFADAVIGGMNEMAARRHAFFGPVGLASIVDTPPHNPVFPSLSNLSGSWRSTVHEGRRRFLRFELLEQAGKQLARLIASGDVRASRDQLLNVRTFVTSFVADGGPSPQVAATEFGAVEVAWVVGRSAVAAIFDDDGSYSVWAQDSNGVELFDLDLDDAMPLGRHEAISALLAEMSTRVRLPIPAV